jgi:cytochrome c biogenesis protein ResB
MPTTADGTPYLFVTGISDDNVLLAKDRPVTTSGGLTYTFRGQVEASGVSVKRDPGDTFIWIAVGMAIVGLAITFYVPRRRLWVKVTPARTYMAGIAEKTTRLGREMRLMGAELGSRDALEAGDLAPET